MSVRLVTVATFDLAYKADIALAALEEAGITAEVNDREIINMDWLLTPAVGGVKLQVTEADAERALRVIEQFTRAGKMTPPVSDEELERQALAEPTEDEVRAAQVATATAATGPAEPEAERDRLANRAMWCMAAGLLCLPAWAVGMYFLLTAAFTSGPLSPAGRFRLQVASVIAAVTTLALLVMMSRNLK